MAKDKKGVLTKTQDPPPPKWPVRTPQVQPSLKSKAGKIGTTFTRKGKGY